MGIECSSDIALKDNNLEPNLEKENINSTSKKDNVIRNYLDFQSYSEYFAAMQFFYERLKSILNKMSTVKKFVLPEKQRKESDFYYYEYLYNISVESLYDNALSIYQKIGNVYGGSTNYPKEELAKISYNLIAKYQAYDYETNDYIPIITDKIIKRINYFSEDFPFKLKKLDKILQSKKIYVFGYDINRKINFYIEPFHNENGQIDIYNMRNNHELTESFFVFNNAQKEKPREQNNYYLTYSDYVVYIFFIIEHVLPSLIEKYGFSQLVNVTINFGGGEPDTEMISYIMSCFTNFYPLGLGKINIVNYKVEMLVQNKTFKDSLDHLDNFRNLVFYEDNYQFQLVKENHPNCLPIIYGGYHSLSGYIIDKNAKLDDFIYYTLSMILINSYI